MPNYDDPDCWGAWRAMAKTDFFTKHKSVCTHIASRSFVVVSKILQKEKGIKNHNPQVAHHVRQNAATDNARPRQTHIILKMTSKGSNSIEFCADQIA